MKNNLIKISLLAFSLSLLFFTSCRKESVKACGALKKKVEVEDICTALTSDTILIFQVVESLPTFGNDPQDLEDYLQENLCVCGMEDIVAGEIIVTAIIQKDGTACIDRYKGTDIFKNSATSLISFMENMPKWNPGKQRGEPVLVYRSFTILIDGGKISLKK